MDSRREDVMPRLLVFALVTWAALGVSADAFAQNRFALVVGNSKYETITALPNPAKDAKAVGELLRSAGFEVTSAADLGQSGMRRAVRDFAAKLADKGEDTVALIYYAGHGVQIDGENYLVPVDAKIMRESDVALEAVRFADVMNMLDSARSRTRIVILDACRNNPFDEISKLGGRGLAMVNAPAGSLVAYSTSPGAAAEDGTGANSPFTAALIAAAKEPGLPVEQALKKIRLAVHSATEGRQTPWEVSSLTKPFAFFPGSFAGKDEPARERSAETWRKELQSRSPQQAFELAVREDSVIVYQQFLVLYPASPFGIRVRALVERRLEMTAWFDAVTLNSADAYQAFLARYPESDLAATARRLKERARLRSALASASPGALGLAGIANANARALPSAEPEIRTVIKEIRVPSPPEIRTVVKEVPSPPEIKTVIKEVPVIKEVIKEVRVPSPPEIKTVIKEVRVPSPPEIRTVVKEVRMPGSCRGGGFAQPGPIQGMPAWRPGPNRPFAGRLPGRRF
jgi:hypothetical protein